jgi:iron complex transport system substrate-binding protein
MRLAAVVLFLALAGCSAPPSVEDKATDWTRRPLRYARSFTLLERGDERLLIVFGHGGTADTVGAYHLSPDGRFSPAPCKAVQLTGPLQRLALLSTTHVPFLSAIGRGGAVVATVLPQEVRDPVVKAAIGDGRVQGLGSAEALDREKLIALRPAVVFGYPFGGQGYASLKDAGLRVVQVTEYLEEHPLGRAEWLRFFGALTGAERQADSVFAEVAARYEAMASSARQDSVRPLVFFGSNWNGQWSVPPGNSYMARLIQDAGGHYLYAADSSNGNLDLDLERVIAEGAKAEWWGMVLAKTGAVDRSDVAGHDPRIAALPAFAMGQLFAANSAEADLFGEAVVRPDVVLRDLTCLWHPERCAAHRPIYFKRVQ